MKARKQILVVEDEIITAMDIQKKLTNLGYNVPVIVCSGEEAIIKAKENKSDLVLMDINLNREMDGIVKPFKDRELQINIEIVLYKYAMEKKLKESYETIREKNRWLNAAIESVGEAVIATDPQGTIKLMNPIAEALTGWKQNEALGKPMASIFNIISENINEKIEDPITKAIRDGIFYGLAERTILITKDGLKRYVDIIGSTIQIDGNKIIGIVFVFDDITWRTKIDDMLKISENY